MSHDNRAQAGRLNGARSRGPTSAAGKARSSQNALKHGLRARRVLLVDGEDAAEFGAFEAAVRAELAPEGALQGDLVSRIVMAAWRARRGDRLEAALLGRYLAAADPCIDDPQTALAAGLVRDGNGPRALETLVRYRGSALAELFRALAALKLLQAQACELGAGGPESGVAARPGQPVLAPPPAATKRTKEKPCRTMA